MNTDTMTLRGVQLGATLVPTSVLFLVLSEPRWVQLLWAASVVTTALLAYALAERSGRAIAHFNPNRENRR